MHGEGAADVEKRVGMDEKRNSGVKYQVKIHKRRKDEKDGVAEDRK